MFQDMDLAKCRFIGNVGSGAFGNVDLCAMENSERTLCFVKKKVKYV